MKEYFIKDLQKFEEGTTITIYGWVHELRDLGGVKFIVLRDRSGILQITLKKNVCSEEILNIFNELGHEDVIKVEGSIKKDLRAPGGIELIPYKIEILNKAKRELPVDVTEKVPAEPETRFDNRVLDLRRPKIQAIFKIREVVLNAGREYLKSKGFIEVYTPKIIASASEGGAELFPVIYYNKEAFLVQSPQLYKQMLVIAGFEKVFEYTTLFRAEESHTTRHLSESTAIDIECAWADLYDIMKIHREMNEKIIETVINNCEEELKLLNVKLEFPEFVTIKFEEAKEITKKYTENIKQDDLSTEEEKALGEHFGNAMVYVTHYPEEGRPFYTVLDPEDPKYTRAFDCIYKGLEITSGSERIHKREILEERLKAKGLNPENFEFYLKVFEYGAPPHGGWGQGVERLLKQMLDLPHVREAIFFPRLPNRLEP